MKTFEERYTAWVDGGLTGEELQQFESELTQHPEAQEDRESAQQLGKLLREFGGAPPLSNPDFFNHQLLASIEADRVPTARESRTRSAWAFGRWGWVGAAACAVVMAVTLSQTLFSTKTRPYMAQIVQAQAADSELWVTPVHSDADDITVLWVDGLEYLPASYQLQ